MSAGAASSRQRAACAPVVATLLLAGFAYRSLAVWSPAPAGLSAVETWLYLPSGTSPQLVLLLSAAALGRRWGRIRASRAARGSPAHAAVPLSAAVLLHLWASYVGAGDLMLASLVLFGLGACLFTWGTRAARELALPLLIALFAIPLPAVLANQVVFPLQLLVAEHTGILLRALGTTVERSGDVLFTATGTVQVIESCSGIRSMDVLTLLALVFVAFFQPGWKRGLALVLGAPLLAYGVNVVRVAWVTAAARGEVVPSGHLEEGLTVFAACVALLLALDAVLSRLLPTPERADEGGELSSTGSVATGPLLVALAGTLALASLALPRWQPLGLSPARIELPAAVGRWQRANPSDPPWTPVASGFAVARYELDGQAVLVFVAHDDRLHRNHSVISPRNAVPGPGWEIEERWFVETGGLRFQAVLARALAGRSLTWSAYQGVDGLLSEGLRATFATDRSCLRRPGEARVLRLSTAVASSRTGVRDARARLDAFLHAWQEAGGFPLRRYRRSLRAPA